MAGRPLRRLRNALRLNPLVGWEDTSGIEPRRAKEPHAMLVKPGARERYAKVYNRVGLPLAVVLRPPGWHKRPSYTADDLSLAKKLRAVLLVFIVDERLETPFYALPEQRRGSPEREAPYTPFMLLHRLGDSLFESLSASENTPFLSAVGDAGYRWAMRDRSGSYTRYSRGVDTAAGRMGVLTEDYLSDLWAKWLLTGRVAYSATNPPPESAEEANFRNMVAEYAPQIFRIWYDYLMRSVPSVFYV
jgi:hypothetical protein